MYMYIYIYDYMYIYIYMCIIYMHTYIIHISELNLASELCWVGVANATVRGKLNVQRPQHVSGSPTERFLACTACMWLSSLSTGFLRRNLETIPLYIYIYVKRLNEPGLALGEGWSKGLVHLGPWASCQVVKAVWIYLTHILGSLIYLSHRRLI